MDNLSFEELLEKLNKTVTLLEKGEQGLEVSMKTYEEGVALIRLAEGKLKSHEKRIEELLADGSVRDLKLDEAK